MAKRTKSHKIDNAAKKIFKYKCPDNWAVRELSEDYGIDYQVEVFDEKNGKSTSTCFNVQLKGTRYNTVDNHVNFLFSTDRLKDYSNNPLPVFLILVDTTSEDIHWLFLQKYTNEILNIKKPKWVNQNKITLKVPLKNNFKEKLDKFIDEVVRGIPYCGILANGVPSWSLRCEVECATKNLNKQNDMIKEEYKNIYNNQLKLALNLMNEDNLEESLKHFSSTFEKTLNEDDNIQEHLSSLSGIIGLIPIETHENRLEIMEYSTYGYDKAKKHDNNWFKYYFKGICLEAGYYINKDIIMKHQVTMTILSKQTGIMTQGVNSLLELYQTEDYKRLQGIFEDFSSNLLDCFESEEYTIATDLLIRLTKINLHSYMNGFWEEYSYEELIPLRDRINSLIELIYRLYKSLDNIEIYYEYLKIKAQTLYYQSDLEYNNILRELRSIALSNDSKYYVNLSDNLTEDFAKNPVFKESIEKTKNTSVIDLEDSEIEKTIIYAIEAAGIDLESNSHEANAVQRGLKDRNPERVLKNCSHLEILYEPSLLGSSVCLESLGNKVLYCKHGGVVEGGTLDFLYECFSKMYCKNCKYKETLPNEWNWSHKWQEEKNNNISSEFKNYLKNRSKNR